MTIGYNTLYDVGDIPQTTSQYDPTVARLQQQLNSEGYRDPQGRALAVDGLMGPLTQYAVQQKAAQITPTATNYYGPDMSIPVPTGGVPTYTLAGNALVASKDGVYQGFTTIPSAPSTPTSGAGVSSIQNTSTSLGSLSSQMSSLLAQLRGTSIVPSASSYNPQIGQLMATLQQRAGVPLAAPESTPQYAAAKARLQQEGTEASTRAVQQMAARGILRSSMTESALQRIEREIVDRLTTQIAPQVQQQLQSERQTELGGLRSDLQSAIEMARYDSSRATELAQMEQAARQFDLQQALAMAQMEQEQQQFGLEQAYNTEKLTTDQTRQSALDQSLIDLRAAQEARALRPAATGTGAAPGVTTSIRDTLLRGLNDGTIREQDLQPWQRDLLGLPQLPTTKERDYVGMALDMLQKDATFAGLPEAEKSARIQATVAMLQELYGAGGLSDEEIMRQLGLQEYNYSQGYGLLPAGAAYR